MMFSTNIIIFLFLLNQFNHFVVGDQHEKSKNSDIILTEFPKEIGVDQLEEMFHEIFAETIETLKLDDLSISRQKRDSDSENQNLTEFFKWYNRSLAMCQHELHMLRELDNLEKMLNDVYYIDQPEGIHLKGDITFYSLTVNDTLKAPDIRSLNGTDSAAREFGSKLNEISQNVKYIETEVTKLNKVLETAMRTTGDQEVSGNITFANAYFDCGQSGCNIKSIETSTFNGRDVHDLSSRVIRLDSNQILFDYFNFSKLIVDNIDAQFINGIDPKEIVTKDGNHEILGKVNFENSVQVNKLDVTGTVNGNRISRDTVLTKSDPQIITSPVSFAHDITITNLQVEGNLTQVGSDVTAFLSNIVQVDQNRVIRGKKIFNNVIVDDLMVEGGKINGFNLTALSHYLLTRNDSQIINADVIVDDLIVDGDIHVDKLNGNKLEDLLVPRNVPTVIRGNKIFQGPVYIRSMEVNGKLNDHPIKNRSLGLLLKRGEQVITGQKDFRDIEVKNLTLFHGNVGPLSFELLKNKIDRMIQGGKNRVLSGPIQLEDIRVNGKINGIELSSLMNDYLKVNQSIIPNVNLNIKRALFTQPLHCDMINGLKFPDDFITTNTDQVIKGNTVMLNDLKVTSSLNLTRINGIEVDAALWDSLTSSGNQVITAPKIINGNLFIKNLNVTSLNGINMNDLVLLNGNGNILGNKTFTSINVAGRSSVDTINDVKSINKIPVDELLRNSITKKGYQSISSSVHVKKLIIPLGTNVNVTELAGMKLNDILSSVVYLNSNETQLIKGRKRFTSQATFGNFDFSANFAGYSREEFTRHYLSRKASEIYADIAIESDLFVDNELVVNGRVNELNIDSLYRNSVNGKPIVINRPMNFRHVRVMGGNIAAPNINGLKFSKQMITKRTAINVTGNAVFSHGVTVDNLYVGSINNVSIGGSVCHPIQHIFSKPYSLRINGNVDSYHSIKSNTVNGLLFNRSNIEPIKGVKRFNKLFVQGPIDLKGRLNNFDVRILQERHLSLTKNQTINSNVIFKKATFSGPVFIDGHLQGHNVLTNGIDLVRESSKVLRRSGPQTLQGTFYFPGKVIFKKEIHENENLYRDLRNKKPTTQFNGQKNVNTLEIDDLIVDSINEIPVQPSINNRSTNQMSKELQVPNKLKSLKVKLAFNKVKLNAIARHLENQKRKLSN